jgi:hypothetical protein
MLGQAVFQLARLAGMASEIDPVVLRSTGYWLAKFSRDYHGEIPRKIHNGSVSDDGSPQWHPDFARWLTAREVISTPRPDRPTPEQRLRTTRAMRKLRKTAVREFEVVYRVMVTGERIKDTTKWLNERAVRNSIPLPAGRDVHYRPKDTLALVVSGIDKMRNWY